MGNWKMGWDPKVACASLVLAKSGGLSVVTLRRLFYPWLQCSGAVTSIVWYCTVILYFFCAIALLTSAVLASSNVSYSTVYPPSPLVL